MAELAHGLAYWAARWQPYPRADDQPAPAPDLTPAAALAAVPRLADQSGGFRDRFARLAELPTWPAATLAEGPPEEARAWLSGLSDAAVLRYSGIAHGNPVMLVHSATAPTAILRSLPALDDGLWAPSAAAAWDAAAALTAIYAPSGPASSGRGPRSRTARARWTRLRPGRRAWRRARHQVRRHRGGRVPAHG